MGLVSLSYVHRGGGTPLIGQPIADYLREHNLPARLKHGDDSKLAGLPWDKVPTLARDRGPADGDDANVAHAVVSAHGGGCALRDRHGDSAAPGSQQPPFAP